MKQISFRMILFIASVIMLGTSTGGLPARAETQVEAAAAPASAYYYSVPGVAFSPETNTDPWSYSQSGCIQALDTGFWRASLHVPDGSILKRLIFGFHNTPDDWASPAYIYAYSLSGATTLVATMLGRDGSTHPGYAYAEDVIDDVVVDNLNYVYVLTWGGQVGQELCYMKVEYQPASIFGLALPMIKREP